MAQVVLSVSLPTSTPTTPAVGARTFSDLVDEVLAHGFGTRYRPRVKVWLNEALGKLGRQSSSVGFEIEATINVVAGTSTYTIPGSVGSIMDVRADDGLHLTNVDRDAVDSFPVASGAPIVYSIFQGRLTLAPTPNRSSTLKVRYHGLPARLNLDTDTTGIPTEYEDLLIHYALWHAYLGEDDPEMGNVHKQEWMEGVQEFRRDTQLEDSSATSQIPGMMPRVLRPLFRRP
jgi:hypothetical protein